MTNLKMTQGKFNCFVDPRVIIERLMERFEADGIQFKASAVNRELFRLDFDILGQTMSLVVVDDTLANWLIYEKSAYADSIGLDSSVFDIMDTESDATELEPLRIVQLTYEGDEVTDQSLRRLMRTLIDCTHGGEIPPDDRMTFPADEYHHGLFMRGKYTDNPDGKLKEKFEYCLLT